MKEQIKLLNDYFKVANYVTVLLMYFRNNFLLKRKLVPSDLKKNGVGHWGNASQINFIYPHLNYYIKRHALKNVGLVIGTGHSGVSVFSNLYLEGTIRKNYKNYSLQRIIRDFGSEKGFRSEINPTYPGMFYFGGELGYSLATCQGIVFGKPNIQLFCIIGDGEAETGTLSSSWKFPLFLNYKTDGVVIPILNLNNYKMGRESLFSKMSDKEITQFFKAQHIKVYHLNFVHQKFIKVLDKIYKDIRLWKQGKSGSLPMIVLHIPKGFSAPAFSEKSFQQAIQSHKDPLKNTDICEKIVFLEKWLKSYTIINCFNDNLSLKSDFSTILPNDANKIGSFEIKKEETISLPKVNKYIKHASIMEGVDSFLYDCYKHKNWYIFSPDELISNKLRLLATLPNSLEILNEQICQAWLFGNALAGKIGMMCSYEGFMPIIDSMLAQTNKFLTEAKTTKWKNKIPSFNYFLSSLWWENCYSHQNPNFVSTLLNLESPDINIQFPIDLMSTILTLQNNFKSVNKINVTLLSKSQRTNKLTIAQDYKLVKKGFLSLLNHFEFDLVFLVMGDSLYDISLQIADEFFQKDGIKVKIIYCYALKVLQELDGTILEEITQGKKLLCFPQFIQIR